VRCCDLDDATLAEQASVALLDVQAQAATKLFNEKKYAEAEAEALKLLDLAPNQRLALRVLFEIRKAQNRPKAAEVLARRLASLPGTAALRAAAHGQLANYILSQGRYADAAAPAAAAVMAAPADATAQHVMGVVLTETGRLTEGERHYRRALALLEREDGLVLANTAWNLKLQGRLDEAASAYERALALRPDNKRGVGGYAQVEFSRGHIDRAIALLEDGLKRWPEERTLRLLRAMVELAAGDAEAVLARLAEPIETLLSAELCTKGHALARLGRPAEAVTHYAAAKKIQRERNGQTYAPELLLARATAYKAYFLADRLLPLPRAAAAAAWQPVFLLGFPRSGTSLLEQLLAQIPGFAAGDDAAPLADLIDLVPALTGAAEAKYPAALDHALVAEGLDFPARLAARYQAAPARAALARPWIRFITDRVESNFWHLGLIKLLFPEAPIIHLLRHPRDVVLSNLSQDRKLEANCGVSLNAVARHYALSMEMIAFFRGQLSLRYYSTRYEELVTAPAACLRRIAEFVGADPELVPPEEILRQNTGRPPDPVPGHYAIREPVHSRGRYRHRDYLRAMPKLFTETGEFLDPWVAALGYDGADS
jgi:tetratricopeptide (TPR) repeat protein